MGCETLRPVGVGLILSPSPTRSSRAGSLCTVHVGSQLGGKEWGPDRLAETMADGPIEKGGSPRTCSLLRWAPTPFPLWGEGAGVEEGKQLREVSQAGQAELGREAEPRPSVPNCSD